MLRNIFGPSQEEIWRQLSDQIGARYVEGGFWKPDKVEATHGEWIVTFDTFAVHAGKAIIHYTRMRAPYVNPDSFRFTVYRSGFFSDVAEWFGMQDIEVGHEEFDRDFMIKGTDESKLRQLFSNARIRELIATQPDLKLTVDDDEGWFGPHFPEGTDELALTVPGVIKDVARLERLYDLFAETLDELCRMGSAYRTAPDVSL